MYVISAAFVDVKEYCGDEQQDAEDVVQAGSNRLDAKLFGQALAGAEVSEKIERQLIDDRFVSPCCW